MYSSWAITGGIGTVYYLKEVLYLCSLHAVLPYNGTSSCMCSKVLYTYFQLFTITSKAWKLTLTNKQRTAPNVLVQDLSSTRMHLFLGWGGRGVSLSPGHGCVGGTCWLGGGARWLGGMAWHGRHHRSKDGGGSRGDWVRDLRKRGGVRQ